MRLVILLFIFPFFSFGQDFFTFKDSLKGSLTPERIWWDVMKYSLDITPDISNKKIKGCNQIDFKVIDESGKMQIDLLYPMKIDSVIFDNKQLKFERTQNLYYLNFNHTFIKNQIYQVSIYFSGIPHEAELAPWQGGWVWKLDALGRPFVSVACQGLGASAWYPCKDHQSDEPDFGAEITLHTKNDLIGVSNGQLKLMEIDSEGERIMKWEVSQPINNYNIVPYFGYYKKWSEVYSGEKGNLKCEFWVLDYELVKAKKQFRQATEMLACFEHWFGPYPFYEDGFKIVQAPFLGMEHQSAIAYGNGFENGYKGKDLSESGWGLKWDFILIHESGHEWFGNNITSKDIADMWIHEAFTNYSEVLFTECKFGKQAGNEYAIGLRHNVKNDKPIIGKYEVHNEGSGDMYYKGSNMVHIIRQLMQDDEKFRLMLRALNTEFRHQTVTSKQVEDFMISYSGLKLDLIFDQYLRTVDIPILQYKVKNEKLYYRWTNCVTNFDMSLCLKNHYWLNPTTSWQVIDDIELISQLKDDSDNLLEVDPNFFVYSRKYKLEIVN